MKYLKYTQYVYLVIGLFFIYDGIAQYASNKEGYLLSFIVAAVCIFMFFFRRNFAKKFEERNKSR